MVGADKGVNFGHLRLQFVAVTLGQTAGHDEPLRPAVLLEPHRIQDCLNGFLLGRFDKAAGIHDHRIRFTGIVCDNVTSLLQLPHHHLAVHQILGAA